MGRQKAGQIAEFATWPGMTEAEFQALVVATAKQEGWLIMHVRRSKVGGKGGRPVQWVTNTSLDGWPDLTLIHPRGYLMFLELKSDTGQPSDEQIEVMRALQAVQARMGDGSYTVRAYIVRPSDWPQVERLIRRPGSLLAKGASVPADQPHQPDQQGAPG